MISRIFAVVLLHAILPAQEPIRGFSQAGAKQQLDLEAKAVALIDSSRIGAHIKRMSAKPHAAGSIASKEVADYALELFWKWGLEAKLETFEALLPYPMERSLEMTARLDHGARRQEARASQAAECWRVVAATAALLGVAGFIAAIGEYGHRQIIHATRSDFRDDPARWGLRAAREIDLVSRDGLRLHSWLFQSAEAVA